MNISDCTKCGDTFAFDKTKPMRGHVDNVAHADGEVTSDLVMRCSCGANWLVRARKKDGKFTASFRAATPWTAGGDA